MNMTTLQKNRINTLSRVLKNEESVEFKHNGFFYEVFESADSGYIVNICSSDEKDNLVDGGLCTGSARDAISFML